MCVCVCIVLFGPVKSELGVIPSGQENHSRAEHLNFPSRGNSSPLSLPHPHNRVYSVLFIHWI